MLWHTDPYTITVGDAAQTDLVRLWHPKLGMIHDPGLTPFKRLERGPIEVHQIFILHLVGGYLKHGIVTQIVLATEVYGIQTRLPVDPPDGIQGGQSAVRYIGPPFLAHYGVGWGLHGAAKAANDKIYMSILYREVKGDRLYA